MGLIWIFMLVAGLWALFTGKLPMVLFSGLGTHKVDGRAARVIGACLAFAVLLSYISIVILNIFYASANLAYNLICGLIPALLFLVGASISVRRLRTPYQLTSDSSDPPSPEAAKIQKVVTQKVRRSAYLVAIGLGLAIIAFPLFGVVVFPLAFIQAGRAISPMKAAHIEDLFQNDVNFLRSLSAVLAVFSVVLTWVAVP